MVGFDSAGELSEETQQAARATAPRTILRGARRLRRSAARSCIARRADGRAAPDRRQPRRPRRACRTCSPASSARRSARCCSLDVAIAVCVCTLAIQTAATRMIFSMSRDNVLPFSTQLRQVTRRTGTPIAAAVVLGVARRRAAWWSTSATPACSSALASVCIMLLYVAYLMVTVPSADAPAARRARTPPARRRRTRCSPSGRWGCRSTSSRSSTGLAMAINLGWPRAEVYDPAGGLVPALVPAAVPRPAPPSSAALAWLALQRRAGLRTKRHRHGRRTARRATGARLASTAGAE